MLYRELRHNWTGYKNALETAYGQPWWRTILTSGPIRAFTLDHADPIEVHTLDPVATLRVRAHEYHHAARNGDHPNPFTFDVRCGHPIRLRDPTNLVENYLEALQDGTITVEYPEEEEPTDGVP